MLGKNLITVKYVSNNQGHMQNIALMIITFKRDYLRHVQPGSDQHVEEHVICGHCMVYVLRLQECEET